MWNYFADAVARLRGWAHLALPPGAADPQVLAAAFPGLRYVWLRRDDKLRQAISWWRAAATGEYGLEAGQAPAEPPPFDRDAIGRLARYARECEDGGRGWFAAHAIRPLEIVYEDMTQDIDKTVRTVAGFLGVTLPPGLGQFRPRGSRQADQHTERIVGLFNRHVET
jgi:LPS sulfotransferase NodH